MVETLPLQTSTPGTRQRVTLPSPFPMFAGDALRHGHLAVETWGRLNANRDNAILVFTGLSASSHAASSIDEPTPGWWEQQIGAGKSLDTDRYFVICANSLGGCFGSTGPGDIDPNTGTPYGASFPELRVEDIASAAQFAVRQFGIEQLLAVVGPSLGGMTALAHAALFPGAARGLVSISGAVAPTAFAIATRALQREIVGTALRNGADREELGQAMRWARKVGVLSYIGPELIEHRYGRRCSLNSVGASGTRFEVEGYLDYQAQKFERTFNPWSYWYISRAMDLFDLAAHGGTREAAFKRMRIERALVIGVEEDHLFPIEQQREVARHLRDAGITTQFEDLSSPHGHDAFLVEHAEFGKSFRDFLKTLESGATTGPFERARAVG